ncbi:hypothetical protein RIF23_06235 [Lipingzhangella sp. LS1_29]|uniref:Uncharacterized protein n=1 Tax=Lipingzhangella rawalii TaxID=2055835 RepID=A0ABU2H3L4_9ACTN|nr:hypothetical protein [Lipingzhangella rawalii]MDS1269891.1 hypothetical protein [Lipingzhangella rawalii]
MEAGAGGYVEYLLDTARLELVDEEAALTLGAALPVDELIPLLDEPGDVLLGVVVSVTNG